MALLHAAAPAAELRSSVETVLNLLLLLSGVSLQLLLLLFPLSSPEPADWLSLMYELRQLPLSLLLLLLRLRELLLLPLRKPTEQEAEEEEEEEGDEEEGEEEGVRVNVLSSSTRGSGRAIRRFRDSCSQQQRRLMRGSSHTAAAPAAAPRRQERVVSTGVTAAVAPPLPRDVERAIPLLL